MSLDRSYQDAVQYLFGLQKHGIKLALANTEGLLHSLDDPQRAFPAVHIAGTNGKGSTAAFLASMLTAAGFRTGLYTSPHLVSFTERIRIDGVPISEARVVELAGRVRDRARGLVTAAGDPMSPTFFEVTTAIAFSYFAEEGVAIAVIETGMGGRLDATNVITPLVSIITTIDLEHTEFLGPTIAHIATEKAGIIKPGVPVVTGALHPEAAAIVARTAQAKNAPVFCLHRDFGPQDVRSDREQVFSYRGTGSSLAGLSIAMLGRYQVDNACVALAARERLQNAGFPVPENAVRAGLAATRWEGRLERVATRPDVYLDGAHNPAAARLLAEALRGLRPAYRRLVLVIGVLADKDVQGVLAELVPLADQTITAMPNYGRALDAQVLAEAARPLGNGQVEAGGGVDAALDRALQTAGPEDLVVVTGSLYVVGDARGRYARKTTTAFSDLKG